MVKKGPKPDSKKSEILKEDTEIFPFAADTNEVYQLKLHQIELELQNEQLRKSQVELEKSQRRYYDLFNFAPVGYISLDKKGIILDLNFTTASMMGYHSSYLKKREFKQFISPEYRAHFQKILKNALVSVLEPQSEIELLTKDQDNLHVLFEIVPVEEDGEIKELRIAIIDVTDRKQVENKVLRSEERFRKSFQDSLIAMALIGQNKKFICANRKLCDLLGYSEKELTNKTFLDITHPDDLPKTKEWSQKILNHELNGYEMEKRYLNKNGKTVWTYMSSSVITDHNGSPSHILVQIQDITNYRKIQQRMKFKASALSQIYDAVVAIDDQKKINYWNKAAEILFGIKKDEIIGKPLDKAFKYRTRLSKPEEDPVVILKTMGYWNGETILITKKGKKLNVESTISILKNDHGEKIGYLAVIRDITYRKVVEDALLKSEENYRTMINTMQAGIWLSDESFKTLHVNSNMLKMMGYTKKEFINRSILDFVDKKGRKRLIRYSKRRLEGLTDNYEIKLKRKDGSDLWLLVAASPLIVKGQFVGSLRVMTDISTRKNVEAQIQDSHKEKMKYLRLVMDSVMALTRYSMEKESDKINPDEFT